MSDHLMICKRKELQGYYITGSITTLFLKQKEQKKKSLFVLADSDTDSLSQYI